MNNMTVGSPMKIIIKFTIPVLLGNFLQLTYNIADTRIVGSFLGDNALAAIGAAAVLYTLYIGFFMGLANGFAIMTARHFGGGNFDKVRTSFLTSLILGMFLSVVIIAATLIFINPLLSFLNVPEKLFSDTAGYIRIVVAGMLITMIYDIMLASARAIGDSVTPLLTLILSVGLNIAGDLILIGYFHTGVMGAAVATVAAQLITLTICTVYVLKKYEFFRISRGDFRKLDNSMTYNMLMTGLSMGFMSSLISIGSLVLQTSINALGNSYIVAQSAARRITEVMMSIFVAIGHTMATYCSQNLGAGKKDRIILGINAGYRITCSWCILVLILVYLFAPTMIRLITGSSDTVMINAAALYLKIDTILYVLVAVIFVLRNSLQGIGDRITPLISSGIEMVGKIILTFTLVPILGYMGVILVEPIVWIVMIIPLIVRIRKWKR